MLTLYPALGIGFLPGTNHHGSTRIVGGTTLASTDPLYKATVEICVETTTTICELHTGALLSNTAVLTAATNLKNLKTGGQILVGQPADGKVVTSAAFAPGYSAPTTIPKDPVPNNMVVLTYSGGLPSGLQPLPVLSSSFNYPSANVTSFVQTGYDVSGSSVVVKKGTNTALQIFNADGTYQVQTLFTANPAEATDRGGPAFALIGGNYYLMGISDSVYLSGDPGYGSNMVQDVRIYNSLISTYGGSVSIQNPDTTYGTPTDYYLDGTKVANTGSGYIELHSLTASSTYQTFNFHAVTPLSLSLASIFRFQGDGPNLMAFQTASTGSGDVEGHLLSGASSFTSYLSHTILPLPVSGSLYPPPGDYKFLMAHDKIAMVHFIRNGGAGTQGNLDITLQDPAAGNTVVQYLMPYATFSSSNRNDYLMAGNDLAVVQSTGTSSGNVGIYIFPASTNYQTNSLAVSIPISSTDSSDFVYAMKGSDLVLIKIAHTSAVLSGTSVPAAEIHILTAASNYQSFSLHAGLPIAASDAANFTFSMGATIP